MVNGYSASPMLWWVEWVDQLAEWGSYASIAAFLAGEDLQAREDSPSDVLSFEAQDQTAPCGAGLDSSGPNVGLCC